MCIYNIPERDIDISWYIIFVQRGMARPRVRWWKAWPSWKVSRWGPHLVVLRTRRPKALLDGLWHWFPRFWYAASTKANSFLPFGMIQMIHAVLYALHRLWQRTCVGSTVVMKAVNTNQEKAACGYKMLWIFDNICIYLKLFLCRWCFYVFSWTFTSVDCDKQWSQLHFLSRPLGRSQRNEFIQHLSLWLQLRVVIQVLQTSRGLHIYPGLSIKIDVPIFATPARTGNCQALRLAVSMAPRGKRNMEMLNVAVAWLASTSHLHPNDLQ